MELLASCPCSGWSFPESDIVVRPSGWAIPAAGGAIPAAGEAVPAADGAVPPSNGVVSPSDGAVPPSHGALPHTWWSCLYIYLMELSLHQMKLPLYLVELSLYLMELSFHLMELSLHLMKLSPPSLLDLSRHLALLVCICGTVPGSCNPVTDAIPHKEKRSLLCWVLERMAWCIIYLAELATIYFSTLQRDKTPALASNSSPHFPCSIQHIVPMVGSFKNKLKGTTRRMSILVFSH